MTFAEQPLVSCLMPTYNRRFFIPWAITYFLRQDYSDKELIIIDDGEDCIRDLVPVDRPCVRYYRLDAKISLGAKLNMEALSAKNAKTAAETQRALAAAEQAQATAAEKRAKVTTEAARAGHLASAAHLDAAEFVRDSLFEAHKVFQPFLGPQGGGQPGQPPQPQPMAQPQQPHF